MADLGKAYVQIIPKAEGISEKIKSTVAPGADAAGTSAGNSFVSKFAKIAGGAALGASVVKGFKAALDEGAKLQQSYGGLDTLYGDASSAAKDYAIQAAQAGISANDYAEQAVSFGASLKAAFGGDTAAAAEAANTAILDMADNAAKMGTPLENIQNAYQGFAKGNYTMLDNLKLGYGGTKSEMERLLADATKLTGVKYNMNNLGDVYSAIHAIQKNLGLTGVAANEAATTFSGSFGAMKAAGQNLLASLALGEGVRPAMNTFINSVGTFLIGNFLPMVGNVLSYLPQALDAAFSTGVQLLVEKGPELIEGLISGITTTGPVLIEHGMHLVSSLLQGITIELPNLAQKAAEAITSFASGFGQDSSGMQDLIAKAGQMITNLAGSLLSAAGILIPAVVQTIWNYFSQTDWVGLALSVGQSVFDGFAEIFPQAVAFVGQVVADIMDVLGFHGLAESVRTCFEDIQKKITGPIESARDLVDKAVAKIKGFFPINIGKILDNIKLPHFTVDGGEFPYGVGGNGHMPSFDVEWYANGGIINRPSLIGAGEAGPEAVVPLSANRLKPLTDAIAEADARNNEQLLNGMYQVFSMALREADFSVTIGRRDFERSLREAGAL